MTETARIELEGKDYELPIVRGTMGEKALDISKLRAQTGYITLDDGYGNTGSCKSQITFIDGDKGILKYRGIPIEELAKKSSFIETAYLVIFGKLPTIDERNRFSEAMTETAPLHQEMLQQFEGYGANAQPMAILSAMINSLTCYEPNIEDINSAEDFEHAAASLMSKVRTIAAASYRSSKGQPFIPPRYDLRYVNNFLHMMFSQPYKNYEATDTVATALNLFFLLHADHEQNCSTSTVRMVASSEANLFASCSAGVSALWGRLHGGANMAVIQMLEQIRTSDMTPQEYMTKVKDRSQGLRLMGFGHRVYKNFDPRAKILGKAARDLLEELNVTDPLLDIAEELEQVALGDDYFVERKLYPNVDFYSGIILRALGIPLDMFTVMFAIGRMPGWIANWKEIHDDPKGRIYRPRQVYMGKTDEAWIPRADR